MFSSSKKRARADSGSDHFRVEDVPFGKVGISRSSAKMTADAARRELERLLKPRQTAENGSTTPFSIRRPGHRHAIRQTMIAMPTHRA